jgi:hypothetical protein
MSFYACGGRILSFRLRYFACGSVVLYVFMFGFSVHRAEKPNITIDFPCPPQADKASR